MGPKAIWREDLTTSLLSILTDFLAFAGVDPATRHAQKPAFA